MCVVGLVKNLDNGKTMGTYYWVCRAVRTAYRRNPPSPRYNKFWDIRLVFSMFQRWGANEGLSTQFLGFKLTMLILLVSGQRGQVIPAFDLRNLTWLDSGSARFILKGLMKTARTGGTPQRTGPGTVPRGGDSVRRLCPETLRAGHGASQVGQGRAKETLALLVLPQAIWRDWAGLIKEMGPCGAFRSWGGHQGIPSSLHQGCQHLCGRETRCIDCCFA